MPNWTKETAVAELSDLINEIPKLESQQAFCADHTRWITRTMTFLEEIFGENSIYYCSFTDFCWYQRGGFIIGGVAHRDEVMDPQGAVERKHHKAYLNQLESAKGLLQAAEDHLIRKELSEIYEGKDTAPEASVILKIIQIGERKLRKIFRNKPQNEKEVQDAFENLLIGADVEYSREAETIEYSSKKYIPDFTIRKLDLAVEIKYCAKDTREKEMIAEINDDILAYKTKFGNVFFLIYDIGIIRDVDRFIDAFELSSNVIVRVVKH